MSRWLRRDRTAADSASQPLALVPRHLVLLTRLSLPRGSQPGLRLYARRGSGTVGIYQEQGLLDGQWIDVIVMEKLLG